jgi:hypothetical protein
MIVKTTCCRCGRRFVLPLASLAAAINGAAARVLTGERPASVASTLKSLAADLACQAETCQQQARPEPREHA